MCDLLHGCHNVRKLQAVVCDLVPALSRPAYCPHHVLHHRRQSITSWHHAFAVVMVRKLMRVKIVNSFPVNCEACT